MHMFYDGGFFMGGMHFLWWIFGVALIGALAFYGWRGRSGQGSSSPESPHEVLRRRMASGEITPEQYEQRRTLLDRDGGPR